MIDNTTAVACINHMGTSHSEWCNMMTQTIWHWCTENDVWLSAAFIPGKENTAADKESRAINLDKEWKLDPTALSHALSRLQAHPDIDLFASKTNKRFDRYVSYRPDPNAYAVDGLSLCWRDLDFYAFPPFSVISQVLGKVKREGAMGVVVVPRWTRWTQVWWPLLTRLLDCGPSAAALKRGATHVTKPTGEETPPPSSTAADGMQDIGARYQRQGFSQQAADLILASWRPATQAAYNCYITKWKSYALRNKVAVNSPSTMEVANFLAELFRCGASHSAVNSARSALSAYLPLRGGFSVGSHPDICRLVTGVFEERPSMPKYSSTWDVKTALDYLDVLSPMENLTLKELTLKTCMLLSLVTGQRGHALYSLSVNDVKMEENKCVLLFFSQKQKTTRPGSHPEPAEIRTFPDNIRLCPIALLKHYLRHIVCSLSELKVILKAAGWSGEHIFHKFYRRRLEPNFGKKKKEEVLNGFLNKHKWLHIVWKEMIMCAQSQFCVVLPDWWWMWPLDSLGSKVSRDFVLTQSIGEW